MSEVQGQSSPAAQTPAEQPIVGSATQHTTQDSTKDAVKAAAQEAKRKLKIDDQEIDEDEVVKVFKDRKQHQRVASKELQEGRAAKKQAEEFINMMKNKDTLFEAMKKLGHDPRKLSEEFLASQLEEDLLDPRDKDLRDTKARLQKYEELEKAQKEQAQKKREDALKAKYAEDFTKQFTEALTETQLPPTKEMVSKMAAYISRSAKIGFEMTPKEAAQLVKEDMTKTIERLLGESDAETLVKLLGDKKLQDLRAFDVAKLKDPAANLRTPEEQPETIQRQRNPTKRMSPAEWRAFNRK